MSFKSFSSTLPGGKKSPAAESTKTEPVQDQPAAPANKTPAGVVPANKA